MAGACKALGESQSPCSDRPRAACLSQQRFPLEPPRANSHIQVSACFIPTPKGVSVQEYAGVDGYPFLLVTCTGCRWLWGHCPPSISQAHPETHMCRAHSDRVTSACAYVHSEGPEAPPCADIRGTGKCLLCIGYVGCRGTRWHCEEL